MKKPSTSRASAILLSGFCFFFLQLIIGCGPSKAPAPSASNPVPSIAGLSPNSVPAGIPDIIVRVTGKSFIPGSIVRWNSSNRRTAYISSTQLDASIAAADIATASPVAVTVFNPGPGGGTSNSASFSISAIGPAISSLSSTSAVAGSSSIILTITGSRFSSSMVVRWNGSDRPTAFVGTSQMLSLISSSDLAVAGTFTVTVYSPSEGLTSNAISFTVKNPLPVISNLSSAAAAVNSPSVINVLGDNFISTSVVYLDGSSYPTSFINRGTLQITVPAGVLSITNPSTVKVVNPAPGGGTSGSITLYSYLSLQARDMVYDPFTRLIYASVSGAAGAIGNTITEIDPVTGTIGRSFYIGSEPGKLAITNDGKLIYASLDGAAAVRVFDIPSRTPGLQFTLGSDSFFGPFYAEDIAILPGNNRAVAVSRMNKGVSPRHAGVAIYDNGIMRPQVTASHTGSNAIEFSASASTLYGYNNETSEFGFRKMLVDNAGVAITNVTQNLLSGYSVDIKYENGRIYSTTGLVLDPETLDLLGAYALPNSFGNLVQPDASVGRTFFLADSFSSSKMELLAFNQSTFASLGSQEIAGVSGSILKFIRWGTNGIALLTDSGQLFVLRSNLVLPVDSEAYTPGIAALSKNAKKGGGNFFLTVYGAGFVPGAVAWLNGEERTTYFINDTELRVAVPSSDIRSKGSAEIIVSNPGAMGTPSNHLILRIE
jgi:trimeric autotransporter adhesin